MGYFIILGIFTLIGLYISNKMKSKFKKYSKIGIRSGMSGAEVAATMLRHYNIHDVKIQEGRGFLSDHYNPMQRTISLSPQVFQGRSIASAAVAAHECGHAVQHDTAYSMLMFRSRMVPIVQFASRSQQYLIMFLFIGGLGMGMSNNLIGLLLLASFGITALFSIITLPVEFDASRRALVWLDESGIAHDREYDGAKDALWWAAMTYVSNALASLVIFLYFLLNFMGRD